MKAGGGQGGEGMKPTADSFRAQLRKEWRAATNDRQAYVVIKSGDLHRQVGAYPGTDHRMPTCCDVMIGERETGDQILAEPPKGKGASLTIRYQLPR